MHLLFNLSFQLGLKKGGPSAVKSRWTSLRVLSNTKWECKYHVVFIPKFRRKALYGQLRDHLGELLRKLATQKESRIEEGHLMPDHVHMMISVPPKYAVSQVIGYVKGKSAIHLARVYGERRRNFVGQHFWARGYFVSTVGRDEAAMLPTATPFSRPISTPSWVKEFAYPRSA